MKPLVQEVPWGTKIEKAPYIFAREFMMQEHNYLCAVCREESAVIDCDAGILQPCWTCQKNGYVLVKLNWFVILLDKIGWIR